MRAAIAAGPSVALLANWTLLCLSGNWTRNTTRWSVMLFFCLFFLILLLPTSKQFRLLGRTLHQDVVFLRHKSLLTKCHINVCSYDYICIITYVWKFYYRYVAYGDPWINYRNFLPRKAILLSLCIHICIWKTMQWYAHWQAQVTGDAFLSARSHRPWRDRERWLGHLHIWEESILLKNDAFLTVYHFLSALPCKELLRHVSAATNI